MKGDRSLIEVFIYVLCFEVKCSAAEMLEEMGFYMNYKGDLGDSVAQLRAFAVQFVLRWSRFCRRVGLVTDCDKVMLMLEKI